MKICRFLNYKENCRSQPKLTENACLLKTWADEFYIKNPDIVSNDIFFLQMEDEFIWKFVNFGPNDVFYPMDRLPKRLEEYLIDKAKEKENR